MSTHTRASRRAVPTGETRPVVALDVDGVVRILTADGSDMPQVFRRTITLKRAHYPAVFHNQPTWAPDGTCRVDVWLSGVAAAWVRGLLARGDVDVVLATTWQGHANRYFAGLLGWPDLPVATTGDRRGATDPSMWKAVLLDERYPHRPVLWVDDNPYGGLACRRARQHRPPAGVIAPDPAVGLTRADAAAADM